MRRASSTCWPRMRSTTRRIFRGEVRTYFMVARASTYLTPLRRSSLACERNVRVGANSPSLCPTIDSEMNTGTCLRPSCTAIVCPSISGTIVRAARPGLDDPLLALLVHVVDLDHQVVVDERTLLDGPRHLATPLPAAANDVLVRRLVLLARAAFLLAPRRRRGAGRPRTCPRRRPAGGRRGSSPHRGRSDACSSSGCGPPCRARSARARRCRPRRPCALQVAGTSRISPRGQAERGHRAFLGHQLDAGAGRAGHLGAGAGLQLDRVHDGADRDVAQRQRVARDGSRRRDPTSACRPA